MPKYNLIFIFLETHFSAIRASVGCSNNPTTEQFKASYKKLMLGNYFLVKLSFFLTKSLNFKV